MDRKHFIPERPLPYMGGLTDPEKDITLLDFVVNIANRSGVHINRNFKPEEPKDLDAPGMHRYQLRNTQKEIEELESCTDEQAEQLAQRAYEAEVKKYREKSAELEQMINRGKTMLAKVEAWAPPDVGFETVKQAALHEIKFGIQDLEYRLNNLIVPTREVGALFVIQRLQMLRDFREVLENCTLKEELRRIQAPVEADRLAAFLHSINIVEPGDD